MDEKNPSVASYSGPKIEYKRPQKPLRRKVLPYGLPHSVIFGSNEYENGDIYELPGTRKGWEIPTDERPYLQHIKNVANGWPGLRYLASWMEVTTSPLKWKHLAPGNREIRAGKTKIAVIDVPADNCYAPRRTDIITATELRSFVDTTHLTYGRLYVVEDLSRDVIEILGSEYNVDPMFWRGHINDCLWYNTRDPWVELDDLPHIVQERNFFNVAYIHLRYFKNEESYIRATIEAGNMNVFRRLDINDINAHFFDDPEAVIAMCRRKISFWFKHRAKGEPPLGILVVDPCCEEGHPLYGGYRNFDPTPSRHQEYIVPPVYSSQAVFEAVIYWTLKVSVQQHSNLQIQPKIFAAAALSIVAAEWLTVQQYIKTRVTQVEWELEIPEYRSPGTRCGLDRSLKRLHPFRRTLPTYRKWIQGTLNGILNEKSISVEPEDHFLRQIRYDFQVILNEIETINAQVQNVVNIVTAIISLEEMERTAKQNEDITRLTAMASIFVPMSFVTGLLSMTSDVTSLQRTFWTFFLLAIPLSLFSFSVAQWPYLRNKLFKRTRAFFSCFRNKGASNDSDQV